MAESEKAPLPSFPPSGALHPECAKMHALGYCVCTMVDCIYCDTNHPPHKPCPQKAPPKGAAP